MRPIWKGAISFGLVSIPVQLYTAVKKHVLGFRLLHKKCGHPISNKRWCDYCNMEVAWEQVEKGLKLKDGSYFIIQPEELKKMKPEKSDNVVISEFVDSSEIYSLYLNDHYYVGPSGKNDRSFILFSDALTKSKRVAIGQFVMKDKEHLCMIEPYGPILLLNTLNYSYEIQRTEDIDKLVIPQKINSKELTLANTLIKQLYSKKFDLSKYKDTFAQKLLKMLTSPKGKKALAKPKKPKKERVAQPSLLSLLKQSIEKVK